MITERYPNFNLEEYLKENAFNFRRHDSKGHIEYAICCPQCVDQGEQRLDTRYRLWINSETGLFHCYNCSWSGSLPKFVQKISRVKYTEALKVLCGEPIDVFEHLNLKLFNQPFEKILAEEDKISEIEFPAGYIPIFGPHEYLTRRGIPWQYAMKNEWGYCETGQYKNRIIVPFYMNDKLVFWQARATWDEPKNKKFKKVINPQGVSSKSVLYNYDTAKKFKSIVLVEGFVDACKVGENAIATNGKTLHKRQLQWLKKTNAEEILLMWDHDSWTDEKYYKTGLYKGKIRQKASIHKAADLLKIYFMVKLVKMPEKIDAGKLPYKGKEINNLIKSAIPA